MAELNYFLPAEWAKHESVWLAWPTHGELWLENLKPAQDEFVAFCEAIYDGGRGEQLKILVPTAAARVEAENRLRPFSAEFFEIPFGDIWLRDTAPVFMLAKNNKSQAAGCFRFNSWGEKYNLPHDPEVAGLVAHQSGLPELEFDFVLEGGSIESDGEGTLLTSRQCLLNPNRNPNLGTEEIEQRVLEAFGAQKLIWFSDGLVNDHTDGHIDTIVRFAGPQKIVLMKSQTAEDPHREVLDQLLAEAKGLSDARGRKLEVLTIPSPGAVLDEEGQIMPASYLNFLITNSRVVVPTYGSPFDSAAVQALADIFPDRRVVGLSARAILSGGGAFHCISQQVPAIV